MALDETYFFSNNTITTSTAITGKDASKLSMNDFFNLLTAQLTNQDMMNPVNDTEFIAQMAQFSSLQGIQTLQEYTLSSYATSYIGKYVTIANQTETGALETITGMVDTVTFYDGSPKVVVNGKSYDLFTVMEVNNTLGGGTLGEASSYVGKTVTVTYKNDFGETKEVTGRVTGVTMKNNEPYIIVYGKEYPLSAIQSLDEESGEDEGGASSTASASAGTTGTQGASRGDGTYYPSASSSREVNDM